MHIRVTLELVVILPERDRVVEEELGSIFEFTWDSVLGEVPREEIWDIGKHEGNVLGQGFREHSGQIGQCIVGADS
jgi:hypothetical protein